MGIFNKSAVSESKTVKRIKRMFYRNYPEVPYISNNREEKWIETALTFPNQCIIPKSMMKRYSDGLLPGHIYMMYWLGRYTNKKVPAYFEYKYGIDFEKEKKYLVENGFLDSEWKPTEKGKKAVEKHHAVIENHSPKRAHTTTDVEKQIVEQIRNIQRNGFKMYTFIANRDCCEICKSLGGRHFRISDLEIGVNAPPMHEGCRCAISAYEDEDEYEAWLNSISENTTQSKKKKRSR